MMNVTKERKARGWSMSRLAREASMHVSTISLIESGRMKPFPSQAEKLAAALGWKGETADLFGEEE